MRRSLGAISMLLLLIAAAGCGGKRTPLNDSIVAGDTARMKKLLGDGASPNELGNCRYEEEGGRVGYLGADEGGSPLICAVVNGRLEAVRLLIDHGADVEARDEWAWSPLAFAVYYRKTDVAKTLVLNGADVDYAVWRMQSAADQSSIIRVKCLAAVRLLNDIKTSGIRACTIRHRPDAGMLTAFPEAAAKFRALPVRPELPEEARGFRVQAEAAFAEKRFRDAVGLYGKALNVSPWWPEGHFNQALILGEAGCATEAIAAMERYLALVPDAPDARAARDKIHQWKGWLP